MNKAETSAAPRFLTLLTQIFENFFKPSVAEILSRAADRHGSLVWEAAWEHEGTRYVTLSVSLVSDLTWQVEVWAAASNDKAYTRKLMFERQVDLGVQRPFDGFWSALGTALSSVVGDSNTIQPGEPDVLEFTPAIPGQLSVTQDVRNLVGLGTVALASPLGFSNIQLPDANELAERVEQALRYLSTLIHSGVVSDPVPDWVISISSHGNSVHLIPGKSVPEIREHLTELRDELRGVRGDQ